MVGTGLLSYPCLRTWRDPGLAHPSTIKIQSTMGAVCHPLVCGVIAKNSLGGLEGMIADSVAARRVVLDILSAFLRVISQDVEARQCEEAIDG